MNYLDNSYKSTVRQPWCMPIAESHLLAALPSLRPSDVSTILPCKKSQSRQSLQVCISLSSPQVLVSLYQVIE